MPIPFACSSCNAKITAPDVAAGRKAHCPKCRTILVVPTPQTADESDDDIAARSAALTTKGTDTARNGQSQTWDSPPEMSSQSPPVTQHTQQARPEQRNHRQQEPSSSNSANGRRLVAIVGIPLLLIFFIAAGLAFYALTNGGGEPSRPSAVVPVSTSDGDKTGKELADAKHADKRLADEQTRLNLLNSELKQREKELADEKARLEKAKDAKKDTTSVAVMLMKSESIRVLERRLDELIRGDAKNRALVATYDKECLTALASAGLKSSDKTNKSVALYWTKREKLISVWRIESTGLLSELDTIAIEHTAKFLMVLDISPDVQIEFRADVQRILTKGRNAISASYDLSESETAEYALVAERVQTEKLAERQKKSEKARLAGLDYCATLRGNDLVVAQAALQRLTAIHSLHVKGELTEDKAGEIWNYYATITRPASSNPKVWKEAVTFSKLSGEWMPDVPGTFSHAVTISEAWQAFDKHITQLALTGKIK